MIFLILFAGLIIFILVTRKYDSEHISSFKLTGSIYEKLYPSVLWMYDHVLRKLKIKVRDSTRVDIASLNEITVRQYIADRGSRLLVILAAVCILSAFVDIYSGKNSLIENNRIKRPEANEEAQEVELEVSSGDKKVVINADINPEILNVEEVFDAFDKGHDELLEVMPGNNESLEKVSEAIVLPDKCQNGLFSVSWSSSNNELVDESGQVFNKTIQTDTQVELTAVLTYRKYTITYYFDILVLPYQYSQEELFEKEVSDAIKKADSETAEKDYIELPKKAGDQKISYSVKADNPSVFIFIFGIAGIVSILFLPDISLKKKMKKRNDQMLLDYSEIVSKLSLLLNCGMTLRKAWEKIVIDYRKSNKKRYAYEEMQVTYNKIQAGFSEIGEYEEFAKRCRVKEYTRLVSLLTQNIRKGSKDLGAKLSYEVSQAFEQRKSNAKKTGEEAATKLLFPMIIMLVIVVAIVIIPVFTGL